MCWGSVQLQIQKSKQGELCISSKKEIKWQIIFYEQETKEFDRRIQNWSTQNVQNAVFIRCAVVWLQPDTCHSFRKRLQWGSFLPMDKSKLVPKYVVFSRLHRDHIWRKVLRGEEATIWNKTCAGPVECHSRSIQYFWSSQNNTRNCLCLQELWLGLLCLQPILHQGSYWLLDISVHNFQSIWIRRHHLHYSQKTKLNISPLVPPCHSFGLHLVQLHRASWSRKMVHHYELCSTFRYVYLLHSQGSKNKSAKADCNVNNNNANFTGEELIFRSLCSSTLKCCNVPSKERSSHHVKFIILQYPVWQLTVLSRC